MAELGVHQSALLTDLALCINRYRLFSPGWYVCVLAKVQLSPDISEVPGLVAMVNYGRNKQCEVRDEVFHGAPNFVLDVFYCLAIIYRERTKRRHPANVEDHWNRARGQ